MLGALARAAKKGLKDKKKKKLTAAEKKLGKTLKKTAKVVKDRASKKTRLNDFQSGREKIMVDGKEIPLKDYYAKKRKKPDLMTSKKAKAMVGSARVKPKGISPQRKGSIAKKASVSRSDIEQAKTKRALDAYENKVNAMKPGNIKNMLKKVVQDKRKGFEKMQASEKDKASRTASNAARSKKMRDKVSLAPNFKPKKK